MIVYIDSEFKCHTENAVGREAVETNFFDGKCDEFIEGYRFVPQGSTWVREDGIEFKGGMITPWKDSEMLEMAQLRYELEDTKAALAVLGVSE